MATSIMDESTHEYPRPESDVAMLARLITDALTTNASKLREENGAMLSRFTATRQEMAAFREGEENRIARLEKAIESLRPHPKDTDPITNFWTVYKKVADEHDDDMASKCVADLDTTLLFSGLFLAVITAFIAILVPGIQQNPGDLSNYLLYILLEQYSSFKLSNYDLPSSGVTSPSDDISTQSLFFQAAQPLFFTSLSLTLFAAFFAVAAKQWILHYARGKKAGNIADRGKERQVKFAALQKWKVLVIIDLLPIVLQVSLLFFSTGLSAFTLADNGNNSNDVTNLTIAGMGLYLFTVLVTLWESGRPFQTPVSVLVLLIWGWARESWSLARSLRSFFRSPTSRIAILNQAEEDPSGGDHHMILPNPTLWRNKPLFTPRIREDIATSAAIWLLENSTDLSAAPAVAAAFFEFQWPSHHSHSTTMLTRLRETYTTHLSAHKFDNSTRLKALQSAAAYYVLYHTQLIWDTSKNLRTGLKKLPADLFLYEHTKEWGGNGVFEYLLHTQDRSELVTSARFLSYIAPYWFCSDSDSAIRSRSIRLEKLHELIDMLESSQAFDPTTLTNCLLCVGAVTDLPLHPEDLIRVDKSEYLQVTFRAVVEHIHRLVLPGNPQHHYVATASEILVTLSKKPTFPPVDAAWITGLLQTAAKEDMDHDAFVLFLRLNALRKEEGGRVDMEQPLGQDHVRRQGLAGTVSLTTPTPEYTLFSMISKSVETCGKQEDGWQDDAVYGGLVAIGDIRRLGTCLPEISFLKTLSDAMKKSDAAEEEKPFRVREAAYDVVRAAQDGWLTSADLRQTLRELDFPRGLHSVVIETGRISRQDSFLLMMETLSGDVYWHSYLRGAMDIWLSFHKNGSPQVLRILSRVAEIPFPSNLPPDKPLVRLIEDEWAAVPGRPVRDLTVGRLEPLVEITKRFKELLFGESDRGALLATVEQVIPSLEKRYDDGYEGPGEDVRRIVGGLAEVLRLPPSPLVGAPTVDLPTNL